MKKALICVCLCFCVACKRYSDFRLPPPETNGLRSPFVWKPAAEPVLDRNHWTDVLNPSVISFRGSYLNLFSAYDGHAWHTVSSISNDGLHWQTQKTVLSPSGWEGSYIAANGSALVQGNEILYWYQAGNPVRIALARSSDGTAWRKQGPVLDLGPRGSWDEIGVADPYVIQAGGRLYLFYLGMDRARRQRLGIARSDDGVRWEKLRSNPILELGGPGAFDEASLGEPAVWSSGGSWWMLYTGSDREKRRRIGLARSADGVEWQRDLSFAPLKGDQSWNSQVLCDPTVEVAGDTVRVWFGGGDVASPDQNLHGQIGFGLLVH